MLGVVIWLIKGRRRGVHLNPKVSPEMITRMKEMRDEGMTLTKIADEMGVAISSVQYHLSPEYRERTIARAMEWQRSNPERAKEHRKAFRRRFQSRYQSRWHSKRQNERVEERG